jgi:hypothetical protein
MAAIMRFDNISRWCAMMRPLRPMEGEYPLFNPHFCIKKAIFWQLLQTLRMC